MSIWNINEKERDIKKLDGDKKVDILIIGAGITGMTTAHFLKDKDICVVDANIVGHGVTLNSTAKINYFQQAIYTDISTSTNYNNAVKYLKSQKEAIDLIKNIIENENIDCDFKRVPSYVFASSYEELEVLEKEVKFLKRNNVEVIEKKLPIKANSVGAYCVNNTYIFNPIKYLNGLYNILINNKINIYEDSKITKIEKVNNKYICYGEEYSIVANKVILASHYPFFLIPFVMPLRCSLEKSYIVVSKVKKDKNFTCINTANPVFSCRYYTNNDNVYQISLSKSHDITSNHNDLYFFDRVKEIFNLKDKDIVMEYTNVDVITPDHMPYIGEIRDDLYIGVGYNTWGMTNGVLAAKIISDDILGIENEYKEVFKPNRINLQTILKLPIYIFNNAKSFIGSKLIKNKKWYSRRVKF